MTFDFYAKILFQHSQPCCIDQPVCAATILVRLPDSGFRFGHIGFYLPAKEENASIEVVPLGGCRVELPQARWEAMERL